MLALTWPKDFLTAIIALIFLMVLMWWRNRFPSKYDVTLHLDENRDAKKPPPESEDSDGGYPSSEIS